MGIGIRQILGNGDGREWELNRLEWEGKGMLKAIPAHLYYRAVFLCKRTVMSKYILKIAVFVKTGSKC